MASFQVNIETDNEAFHVGKADEIARILRELADRLVDGGTHSGTLSDFNGNKVGTFVASR